MYTIWLCCCFVDGGSCGLLGVGSCCFGSSSFPVTNGFRCIGTDGWNGCFMSLFLAVRSHDDPSCITELVLTVISPLIVLGLTYNYSRTISLFII